MKIKRDLSIALSIGNVLRKYKFILFYLENRNCRLTIWLLYLSTFILFSLFKQLNYR